MAGNTFGTAFKVTTFGESHGDSLGAVIDGIPSGIKLDVKKIQDALDRRKPGSTDGKKSSAVTARKEDDKINIISGLFNGFTTGTPLCFVIKNENQHSSDYSELSVKMRPGHADYTYLKKYGFRDYRGGGKSSGRETCARVASGEIARQVINFITKAKTGKNEVTATAYTLKAAGIKCSKINFSEINKNQMRAPDSNAALNMLEKIEELRKNGNSAGGIIECQISNLNAGIGEPVFDKLDAVLAHAMLSIGAVKGIEFGSGFDAADSDGLSNNDPMTVKNSKVNFISNNAGGILGGISNGDKIVFRLALKPVPSIFIEQQTVEAKINPDSPDDPDKIKFKNAKLKIKGRHDVCLCPRIVPVVEAMTYIVLADMILRS